MRATLMLAGVAVAVATGCGGGSREARDTAARVDSVPFSVDSTSMKTASDTSNAAAPAAPAASADSAPGAPAAKPAANKPMKPAPKPLPPATPVTSAKQAADTVRGRAAVVGSSPFTQVVIRSGAGSTRITGPLALEIGRASGAEVWVKGTRSDRGIEATEYHVRSVDGVPAVDGVLVSEGEHLYLRLADGSRRQIVSPPASLRAEAGARVWLTGGIDGPVAAYGVLRPRS